MGDVLLQALGLVLLFAALAWGYHRWITPHAVTLNWQGRGLLLLIILTLVGGFIGSPFWWFNEPRAFSWTLPPLASRMLAAAGWSFVMVCWFALQRPVYKRLRLVLLLLCIYLTPLGVAAILFHLDRFDPNAPITYVFFIIVITMIVATMWYLYKQPIIMPETDADTAPSTQLIKGWLALVATITGLWGLALFLTDHGPSGLIWVWPGDLLTSRLIGVMLMAIAVGCAYSWRNASLSRMMLRMLIVYGLGLAVASLWNAQAIKVSYFVVFGIIFIVSCVLLIEPQRRLKKRA